ncbi:trypsin, alkaline A-like [Anticarsia gemmatalis]|uniref:trypsin, alkaline A-like n=1 Tax=Anticarsia gemmatalis TaxID=129554 RepID=UPI003F75BE88
MLKMKLSIIFLVYFFVNIKGQRIAGGATTTISQYPFAASLVTNGGVTTAEYAHGCGGSILTTNAILSAASCFFTNGVANQVSWWRARVGSSSSRQGGTIHMVNRITTHPDFSTTTRANDIAVIRTTTNINLLPGVAQAARIAGGAYTFDTNQRIIAIGWGAVSSQTEGPSEELRHVQVWTINQQTCANRYNALGFTVTANMVCVGWLDVGVRGQCPGDAGSPILDDSGAIVGVFSWAEGCANSWFPDINTRIAPYTSWIVGAATA